MMLDKSGRSPLFVKRQCPQHVHVAFVHVKLVQVIARICLHFRLPWVLDPRGGRAESWACSYFEVAAHSFEFERICSFVNPSPWFVLLLSIRTVYLEAQHPEHRFRQTDSSELMA